MELFEDFTYEYESEESIDYLSYDDVEAFQILYESDIRFKLKRFIDKVIRYLYEDVLKHRQDVLFSEDIHSLMDIRMILLENDEKERPSV